jgi:hypothetical protein
MLTDDEKPTSLADDLRSSLATLQAEPSAEPDGGAPDEPSALTEDPPELTEGAPEVKPAGDRPRREDGTYAPKAEAAKVAPKAGKPAAAAPPDPDPTRAAAPPATGVPAAAPVPATATKAPASWRPEVREKWAGLPPDVQAEIGRREREAGIAIQQAAPHRAEAEGWRQVTGPYEMMFRASGMDARQGVDGLLRMAATLFTAPEPAKAEMLADLFVRYGVTPESFANAVTRRENGGATPAPEPPPPQEFRDPRVDQWLAREQRKEQESIGAEVEKMRTHARLGEFFDDLREEAGIQLAAAAQSNRPMTVGQAFERAALLHEGVRSTLDQRKAKEAVAARAAELEKKKRASGGLRSLPAVAGEGEADPKASLRSDIDMVAARLRAG